MYSNKDVDVHVISVESYFIRESITIYCMSHYAEYKNVSCTTQMEISPLRELSMMLLSYTRYRCETIMLLVL